MPFRKTSLRRRLPAGDITPEQIETLISGDWEHGALIPRRPEFAGPTFTDLEHARRCWKRNYRLVLKIHRLGWQDGDCEPTMTLEAGDWLRFGKTCWAEQEFGLPPGGEKYLASLGKPALASAAKQEPTLNH
jgi:hypothetical protein